ncbi:hypothetical protein VTK73DRAFT_7208 [Phialemonium thermophilum]|uniref:Uncharacterized protein n=1 Tax=Phialemonium thermophilum TaxID=223376 RepID=A0ABR3WGL1_9PEZI
MSYPVYLVAYLGAPRNHHALFIETDPNTHGGILFHVVGDIQNGMTFEERPSRDPSTSASFVEWSIIGYINPGDIGHMRSVCTSIPPPKKQFHGPRRLYPNEPLRRCQEWTNETINALTANGILVTSTATDSSGTTEYWTWSPEYNNWYHVHEDGSVEWSGVDEGSGSRGSSRGKGKGKSKSRA